MTDVNDSLNESLKELGYVAIGLGVLGFQKAQVRRRELLQQIREQRPQLESQLQAQLSDARTCLGDLVAGLGEQLRGGGRTDGSDRPGDGAAGSGL